MSEAETIDYNGVTYDHTSLTIRKGGIIVDGVKSINWSQSREGEKFGYGTSVQPTRRTRGQLKPGEVSLEFYKDEYLAKVVDRLGDGFMDVVEDIVIEGTSGGASFIDTIRAFRQTKDDKSSAEGGDILMDKITGSCMYVLVNGKLPMKGMIK